MKWVAYVGVIELQTVSARRHMLNKTTMWKCEIWRHNRLINLKLSLCCIVHVKKSCFDLSFLIKYQSLGSEAQQHNTHTDTHKKTPKQMVQFQLNFFYVTCWRGFITQVACKPRNYISCIRNLGAFSGPHGCSICSGGGGDEEVHLSACSAHLPLLRRRRAFCFESIRYCAERISCQEPSEYMYRVSTASKLLLLEPMYVLNW